MMLMSLRIEYCCFPDRDKGGQDGGEEEDEVKDEKKNKRVKTITIWLLSYVLLRFYGQQVSRPMQ